MVKCEDKELISVIVPIYNAERYLNKCIDSIVSQTYKNIEILLIDDGSTDNSGKICDKYSKKDKKIKVIHKENNGVSSARNVGLDNAKGNFITFIDADDYIENNYCEKLIKGLKEHYADCISCGYNRIYNNKEERIIAKENYELNSLEFLEKILLVQNGLGFCHMKLFKKEVVDTVRFNENIKVGEDALFCIEISKHIKKFYMLNEPLYNYRFNENSLVREYDEDYVNKYLTAMKETKSYLEKNYNGQDKILEKINNYITYHLLLVIVNYCTNPQKGINTAEQADEIKKVCNIEEFKNAVRKTNYEGLSMTRKISVFTIKHELYYLTAFIGKIRQKQFRNIREKENNEENKNCK